MEELGPRHDAERICQEFDRIHKSFFERILEESRRDELNEDLDQTVAEED